MKYELASSSTEEGEIRGEQFPYYKSHIQYFYYPLTTKFVGSNSLPHVMNYKNEGMCLKLKKEIKADYPYISFNLLDSHKPFFDNKFKMIGALTSTESNENPLKLLSIDSDYKEIKKFEKRNCGETRYDKFFKKFFFKKEDAVDQNDSDFYPKLFCFEDQVLQHIENENAFIFLRVSEDSNSPSGTAKKYAFEDIFFKGAKFYEFLEIFQESLVKSHNSEEIRRFSCGDAHLTVFSSTVFKQESEVKRIFNTVDFPRNIRLLFNKDGPKTIAVEDKINNNVKYLLSLDLPDGDYAINCKNIYKISNDGEHFKFTGIDYEDFTTTIWEMNG